MTVVLYAFPLSAPCRAVLLLAQLIGVALDVKPIDLMKGEQLADDFIKINPQHTVPTMVDSGAVGGELVLWESRAIMTYLTASYAANDSLYPADVRQRAIIDQRLQFDLGTLYQRVLDYYFPTLVANTQPNPDQLKRLNDALGFLNAMLAENRWATGATYTVADVALTVTVAQIEAFGGDLKPYAKVVAWLQRSKDMLMPYKYDDIMAEPLATVGNMYKSLLKA